MKNITVNTTDGMSVDYHNVIRTTISDTLFIIETSDRTIKIPLSTVESIEEEDKSDTKKLLLD